jgi:hypothetical protein
MGEFTQRKKDRLTSYVAQKPRLRLPNIKIDPLQIENPDHNNVIRCPVCFHIPSFPIIYKFNHILCKVCFVKNFSSKMSHRGNEYLAIVKNSDTPKFLHYNSWKHITYN